MVEKTNSDVDRALEAFGGSALKYRSFGSFTPKPGHSAISPPVIPIDDADVDPFATIQPASSQSGFQQPAASSAPSSSQADAFYPLLGAAMPEASSVPVQGAAETASRRQTAARPSFDDLPIAQAPFPPRQVRPATAYVPPTTPAASPAPPAPAPRHVAPPEPVAVAPPPAPVVETHPTPPRAAVFTPVAERGWVPPPPMPEPPAPVAPPAPPPPLPVAEAVEIPAPPRDAPPPPPRDIPPPPPAAPRPSHALGDHFERFETQASPEPERRGAPVKAAAPVADAADRRSLAEMFRVLSGSSEAPRPQAAPIGRFPDEEPGLFRRL